jgi:hypothetical protein
MSFPRQITTPPQSQWQVRFNEAMRTLAALALYGRDDVATTGRTLGYFGGDLGATPIADGTVGPLAASDTSYIVAHRTTGAVTHATTTANWNDTETYGRLYEVECDASVITAVRDWRFLDGGFLRGGGSGFAPLVPEATTSRDVTPADAGAYLRFTATGAKTANFDVADGFAAGEEYHLANRAASGNLTITPTGITVNAPKGGTAVLEPGDTATLKFVDTDEADLFGSTEDA